MKSAAQDVGLVYRDGQSFTNTWLDTWFLPQSLFREFGGFHRNFVRCPAEFPSQCLFALLLPVMGGPMFVGRMGMLLGCKGVHGIGAAIKNGIKTGQEILLLILVSGCEAAFRSGLVFTGKSHPVSAGRAGELVHLSNARELASS